MAGDTLVITVVWESKVHSDRFAAELLGPAVRAAALPSVQSSRAFEYEAAEQFVAAQPVQL